jgi:hypothetical protein
LQGKAAVEKIARSLAKVQAAAGMNLTESELRNRKKKEFQIDFQETNKLSCSAEAWVDGSGVRVEQRSIFC